RPPEVLGAHIAARHYFQGREKLFAEKILAASNAGKGGGRADDRALADLLAEIGLHPPDGGDEMAVDAIGFLPRIERRFIALQDHAAVRDALVADEEVEVIPDRFGEFGLRVQEIHDAQLRRKLRHLPLEERTRYAAAFGRRPQAREAIAEIRGAG